MSIASPKVNKFLALFLAVILLLACCFSVPSHAVAIVDDAAAFSLVALLSSWGFSFAAIDGDKGQVTEAINDLLGAADVVLDYASSLVTPAGAGLLKISPSLYNAGLKVGQYLINQVGSDSGSHVVVSGGYTYFEFTGSSKTYSTLPSGVTLLPFQSTTLNLGSSVLFLDIDDSSKNFVFTLNGNNAGSGFNDVVFQSPYNLNPRYIGFRVTSSASTLVSVCFVGYNPNNQSWLVSPVGNSLSKLLFDSASSGFSFDANLSDASVPVDEVTAPMYVQTPTASYTTNQAMTDFWYGFMSDQAIPYPTSTTVPWDDVQTDVMTGIGSNVQTMSQTLTGIRDFMSMLVEDTVGFVTSLPSYLSSLSGKFLSIWYYVVNWVQSLRPWLNTMFTIWNGLPAAMVVPVWATAVIVIVIGMYRRFFM